MFRVPAKVVLSRHFEELNAKNVKFLELLFVDGPIFGLQFLNQLCHDGNDFFLLVLLVDERKFARDEFNESSHVLVDSCVL